MNPTAGLPVALVTHADGEAGRRVTLDLLHAGYRVVVTGKRAGELTRSLHGHSRDRVWAIAADLGDPWQARQLSTRILERFGRLDHIIAADTGHEALPAA